MILCRLSKLGGHMKMSCYNIMRACQGEVVVEQELLRSEKLMTMTFYLGFGHNHDSGRNAQFA